MSSFPFAGEPDKAASDIVRICAAEQERQWQRLVMIPSETICHPAAAAVLGGALGNIYAEGLPKPILCHDPRPSAGDEARFQSWRTRLSDRRFYKGTVNADRVELIAHKRIAEVFAALEGSPSEAEIYVNVQALSGAAANLAVYEALLEPGDRIVGLDLAHGGHLTHGSEFNVSGKRYEAHSYGVDPATRRLDYGQVRERVLESKPRLIIGGASGYSWDFDWAALREIADEAGAYLLTDVAHLAGLVAAGVLNNPLPHAHVVTFTTHKTLCGPRGAVILTTDPQLAGSVDTAVFPGMQGGPHMNSIAAIARLFELIQEDCEGFRKLQRRIVDNTQFFAECLAAEGFTLEYGGTNTHMLLVDLKKFPVEGETFVDGEIGSRLLEIAGIVCNKNVIPGDSDGAHASGLRFGLPWLTQRGVSLEQLSEIAGIVGLVLSSVRTITVWSRLCEQKCRGRVPPGVLDEAAERTLAIAESLPYPARPRQRAAPRPRANIGDRTALLVRGDKVRLALDQMLTARLPAGGAPVHAWMLEASGAEIDDVIAVELEPTGREERWLVLPHEERAVTVRRWIEDLSDGYLLFDHTDLQQKVDGPNVVEEVDASALPKTLVEKILSFSGEPASDPAKPYFIGQQTLYASAKLPPKAKYEYAPKEQPLRKTVLNPVHQELSAKMAPFAGWEMPIHYPAGIIAEHRAVRTAAGLFDVSHMTALEVSGAHALTFLDGLLANCVSRLDPGEAQYSFLLRPDGNLIDDVYVYRLGRERFMLVGNAANAGHVKDWFTAANSRRFLIDEAMPAKELDGPVVIRDLRDAGEDSRAGLALQGPASLHILQELAEARTDRAVLHGLLPSTIAPVSLLGLPALVARTGYTGETVGFEIYVHPHGVEQVWEAILKAGRPLGALPAGLGARDSTRIEAGLLLFGQEIEGELAISMTEAGYGASARFHVPFFVGRKPYMERVERRRRHILRLMGQGRKTLRHGHVILDASGKAVGQVTSFAYAHEDMTFYVLACVDEGFQPQPGETISGARIPAGKCREGHSAGAVEDRLVVELTVMTRHPEEPEPEGWAGRYA